MTLPRSEKSRHWDLRREIADACEKHAAKLRTPVGCEELRAAGMSVESIQDLIVTLERAAAGLRL